MAKNGYDPLDYVIANLKEGGASPGELVLARQRGKQILEEFGDKLQSETERYILDTLKTEFGLSSPTLDKDQEKLRKTTLYSLQERINDPVKRGLARKGWLRGGKEKEGD